MESEMQSPSNAAPEESTAAIDAAVDGDGAFRDRVAHLRTWAVVASSRARDLSYEWPAVACALAAFYLLLVVPSTQTLGVLDIGALLGLLGAGYSESLRAQLQCCPQGVRQAPLGRRRFLLSIK